MGKQIIGPDLLFYKIFVHREHFSCIICSMEETRVPGEEKKPNASDESAKTTTETLANDGPPPAPGEIERVANRVRDIDNRVSRLESDTRGFWGWTKKWGSFVGLLAGLLGIPKASIDMWSSLSVHPKASIVAAYPLTITYDLQSHRLSITFPFTIQNAGTADEVIKSSWARLVPPKGPQLDFESAGVAITDKGVPIAIPFTINKASSRDLGCMLSVEVKPNEVPRETGKWTLSVEFTGTEKMILQTFRFFTTAATLSDLTTGGGSIKLVNGLP
jgi:hypothetical protein